MFAPKYRISDLLLSNIKKIATIVSELNSRSFTQTVLAKFEREATSLSVHASTSIEGNPLPLTDVKRILKTRPENLRETEREILNYNSALERLHQQMKGGQVAVSLQLICNIQQQVTDRLIAKHRCGKTRTEPVFVNDPRSGKTVYWPPDHQDVPRLMDELLDFVRSKRGLADPLVLAGIFHRQFVIIHPFMDGNGRTARLATKTILADMGLNTFNLFSFENYYNNNVSAYFQKVGAIGNYYDIAADIDFTEWLEYFTGGIIDELLRVKKDLAVEAASPSTRLQPHDKAILDFIRKEGFITDRDYAGLTDRAKATRALDFRKLIEQGLIERFGKGRATHYKLKS